MLHVSLITTRVSPALKEKLGNNYSSSETESSYSMVLVRAAASVCNRKAVELRTLADKPPPICEPPGCEDCSKNKVNSVRPFLSSEHLRGFQKRHPSVRLANFLLCFCRQIQTAILQIFNTHVMGKRLVKGFLVPKMY